MKSLYFTASASALVLATALSTLPAKPQPGGDAANCAALQGRKIAPDTVIGRATWAPDGDTVGGTKISQPFCRVSGVATPSKDSHIGFEVWLPPASVWNGKFRGEGSGGSAGALSPGQCAKRWRPVSPPCPPTMAISPTTPTPWAAAPRAGHSSILKR